MSRFTMPYETLNEIDLRLTATIIRYDGAPYYVGNIREKAGRKFTITLWSGVNTSVTREYGGDNDKFDLSPFDPMYRYHGNKAYWITRIAKRMYQQGANSRNTTFTEPGSERAVGVGGWTLLEAYRKPPIMVTLTKDIVANMLYNGLSVILNDHLAMYLKNGVVQLEYKGTLIGTLKEGDDGSYSVFTENESLSFNPWCCEKLRLAGIKYEV